MSRAAWQQRKSRRNGFEAAGGLVKNRVKKVAEARGISLFQLLTSWDAIVGKELAQQCQPLRVLNARAQLGATLELAVNSSCATMISAQSEQICHLVNAVYGYRAIARISLKHSQQNTLQTSTDPLANRKRTLRETKPIALSNPPDDAVLADALASLGGYVEENAKSPFQASSKELKKENKCV